MKREIAEFLVDSFVDFNGNERKFVVCALSRSPKNTEDEALAIGWTDGCHIDYDMLNVNRYVSIGASLCHPSDEFDKEIGKKIAKNKASDDRFIISQLFTPDPGVINNDLVNVYLKREAKHIKANPEKVFKGYACAYEKFLTEKQHKEEVNRLTKKEYDVYQYALEGDVDLDYIKSLVNE